MSAATTERPTTTPNRPSESRRGDLLGDETRDRRPAIRILSRLVVPGDLPTGHEWGHKDGCD